MTFAHRARVLVALGTEQRRGRIVSKVNGVDAYTVAVAGRRITVSASELRPNNSSKTTEKGK